jgi:acetyltransferase EpsM
MTSTDFPVLGPVVRGLDEMPGSGVEAFLALGTYRSWRSCQVWAALSKAGVQFPNLFAPSVRISPSAKLGTGGFFMDGAYVGAFANVGHLFGAHAGAIVEHHATIGDNVLLGSAVAIAGGAGVASHCFIGTNCTILPEVQIGRGTLVGAGSVVSRDLPGGIIATGSPAKRRRAVGADDEVPHGASLSEVEGLFAC